MARWPAQRATRKFFKGSPVENKGATRGHKRATAGNKGPQAGHSGRNKGAKRGPQRVIRKPLAPKINWIFILKRKKSSFREKHFPRKFEKTASPPIACVWTWADWRDAAGRPAPPSEPGLDGRDGKKHQLKSYRVIRKSAAHTRKATLVKGSPVEKIEIFFKFSKKK